MSEREGELEPVHGIELAFWAGEIWAQDDDTQGGSLFTHAEGVAYTTTVFSTYDLYIISDTYKLQANNESLLNGRLRDYSNFGGLPPIVPDPIRDPYEIPNLIFLGDDTSSASARFKLDYVALEISQNSHQVYLPAIQQP